MSLGMGVANKLDAVREETTQSGLFFVVLKHKKTLPSNDRMERTVKEADP